MKTSMKLPVQENPLRTRSDLKKAFTQLCDPLKPLYTKGKAGLDIGRTGASYPDSTAQFEGFSRVLWGLAPLLAAGDDSDLWESHLQGIKNGTNPESEEYWGDMHDFDQKLVETAAFGFSLVILPHTCWDSLNEQEKQNLYKWLGQVNKCQAYDCNWLFFQVLVNIGLKRAGTEYNQALIEKNLERIEHFYQKEGWYTDGIGGHTDYYVPFAFHYYGLLYAKWMEDEDPERSKLYKERAEVFAKDFIYWFSEDGSSIPYGRSLAYRFAQGAFWSAAVYAEIEPFPIEIMKGIILRHLRWWFGQPIFDRNGILTIGYMYPNLVMAENYNAPGSPYWSFKSFLPLALPESHPFWQAEELPLPELEDKKVQQLPHMVICRQKETNHVLAFNTGYLHTNDHTHTSAKYEKFVYSNVFGFSTPRAEWGLSQGAFDSTLALSERGDHLYRVKRKIEEFKVEEDVLIFRWKPWADVEVKTWIVPGAPWHIRIHCIQTARPLDAAEGGFALGIGQQKDLSFYKRDQHSQHSGAVSHAGKSFIKLLYGGGTADLIYPNANTNIIHNRTVIPTIKTSIEPGITWLASAVYGSPHNQDEPDAPEIDFQGNKIRIQMKESNEVVLSV